MGEESPTLSCKDVQEILVAMCSGRGMTPELELVEPFVLHLTRCQACNSFGAWLPSDVPAGMSEEMQLLRLAVGECAERVTEERFVTTWERRRTGEFQFDPDQEACLAFQVFLSRFPDLAKPLERFHPEERISLAMGLVNSIKLGLDRAWKRADIASANRSMVLPKVELVWSQSFVCSIWVNGSEACSSESIFMFTWEVFCEAYPDLGVVDIFFLLRWLRSALVIEPRLLPGFACADVSTSERKCFEIVPAPHQGGSNYWAWRGETSPYSC